MKIMAINCGSSSLKFKLYEMPEEKVLTSGLFERIGMKMGDYVFKQDGTKDVTEIALPDHSVAVEILLKELIRRNIIKSLDEIKGVGHRVVQGGKYFTESALVTEESKAHVKELIDLAPLHNKAHLIGVEAFEKALPNVKQIFVFDTAYHNRGMEPEAYMYAVPYYWYTEYGIRKYGAHGTSHEYIANEYARLTNQDVTKLKIVSCHIGNGASICANMYGKCKDTSMGLTPLEGIPMGTRTGNIDPTVVSYICEKENKDPKTVVNELNKKSGYLGVSEISSDCRDLEDAIALGNERAKLTLDIQAKRIADYIGSYYVLMEGIDAICFSAGIGENSPYVRKIICDRLKVLGVKIDDNLNTGRGIPFRFSTPDSKIDIWNIPTDEEVVIARDTLRLTQK